MHIPAGETVFVIGHSGCGKSTLSNIILHLYDVLEGSIYVDGYPVESLSAKWLLNNITVVEQQSVLFNTTIRENVCLCRSNNKNEKNASEKELNTAISFACLESIIAAHSKGLDTEVGPGGSRLSGGQRQRVALARARIRDTPILILDESLSALDSKTRETILENIRIWRKGKTTIIITHELNQIKPDDYVFILEKGRCSHEGFRKDLEKVSDFFSQQTSLEEPESPFFSPFNDAFKIPGSPADSTMDAFGLSSPADSVFNRDDVPLIGSNESFEAKQKRRHSSWIGKAPQIVKQSGGNWMRKSIIQAKYNYQVRPVSGFHPGLDLMAHYNEEISKGASNPSKRQTLCPPDKNNNNNNNNINKTDSRPKVKRTSGIRPLSAPISPLSPAAKSFSISIKSNYNGVFFASSNNATKTLTAATSLERFNNTITTSVSNRNQTAKFNDIGSTTRETVTKPFTLGYINPEDAKDLPIPTLQILKQCYQQIENKTMLFIGVGAAVINGAVNTVFSFAIAQIFTSMFPRTASSAPISTWVAVALVIALVDAVTIYLRTSILCLAADRWVRHLRVKAFESVLERDVAWFTNNQVDTGELSTLILNSTEDLRGIITLFLTVITTCASLSVICVAWVMALGWKLSMVTFALVPLSYLSYIVFKVLNKKYEYQCINLAAKVDEVLYEIVSGIRTLRILGIESYFIAKFNIVKKEYAQVNAKDAVAKGLGLSVSDFSPVLCQAILLWYGMKLVSTGEYTVTQTMMIFTILLFSITTVSILLSAIPQMHKPLLTATRILQLLKFDKQKMCHENFGRKLKFSLANHSITFDNVSFCYTSLVRVTSNNQDAEAIDSFVYAQDIKESSHDCDSTITSFNSNTTKTNTKDQNVTSVHSITDNYVKDDTKNSFFSFSNNKTTYALWNVFKRKNKSKLLQEKIEQLSASRRLAEIPVLYNFSLTIPANTTVALVGPSGSGKSTVTSLLTKLYEPTSGKITIGDIDIKDIDTTVLRTEIAVVGQMPLHFFHGTIYENLIFGLFPNCYTAKQTSSKKEPSSNTRADTLSSVSQNNNHLQISLDDIRKVCADCAIDDFISSLPQGYDTMMGGTTGAVSSGAGNLMSGGQMQRLGLARALLRRPKVLILDEFTSGLDPSSTQTILTTLKDYKNKPGNDITMVLVTHQLETVELADFVVTIVDGHIVRKEVINKKYSASSL